MYDSEYQPHLHTPKLRLFHVPDNDHAYNKGVGWFIKRWKAMTGKARKQGACYEKEEEHNGQRSQQRHKHRHGTRTNIKED